MSNPLSTFHNAVLIIPASDTVGFDSVGNRILISGADQEFKAYLKQSTKDLNVGYTPGTNSHNQFFTGYVVEPERLPTTLKLPATVKARKRYGQADKWIEGKFEILPQYLPIRIVEDVLGDAIAGYFLVT